MMLADRLRDARHAEFTGRSHEVERFAEALGADEPFRLLYIYGPGGVGKSALLREFRYRCEDEGIPVCYLDAQEIGPSPEALQKAVKNWTVGSASVPDSGDGLPAGVAPPGAPDSVSARTVLLLDTYEAVASLDAWIRESLLPQLPEGTVVVIAGRGRPTAPWRTDAGWRTLVDELPLRNLTPGETKALLARLGVPERQHEAALAFTHGYPLAIALVAEACRLAPDTDFVPSDAPDVVEALVRRLVDEVPTEDQRAALEASAIARTVTEPLLTAALGHQAADEFHWLQELTFMQRGPEGLFPHDLAREALTAELRWRAPEHYEALHTRIRQYYTDRLQESHTATAHQQILAAYAFLYRDHPVAGPLIDELRAGWKESEASMQSGTAVSSGVGAPTADEWDVLHAMVERHEGEAGAALTEYWFRKQPESVEVFREDGRPVGLLLCLRLEQVTGEDAKADPVVAAVRQAVSRQMPLREGERALMFRTWLDHEAYQGVSPAQSLIFARTVWHYLTTPSLAVSVLSCRAPHAWGPILAFADLHALPGAAAEVAGQRFEAFAHDWRAVPPEAWLRTLATRYPGEQPATHPVAPRLVVLSEPDFADAVKDALRAYARPQQLVESPLLHSRLITERAGTDADRADRVAALCAWIDEVVEELEQGAREQRYARALQAAYLKPAPSQAIAAERLDLPFSTFRRHLKRGVLSVTEALWKHEVG